jgi:hypothetical protein
MGEPWDHGKRDRAGPPTGSCLSGVRGEGGDRKPAGADKYKDEVTTHQDKPSQHTRAEHGRGGGGGRGGRDWKPKEAAINPQDVGLGPYKDQKAEMARITEDQRYKVRNITAQRVFEQLQKKPSTFNPALDTFEDFAPRLINEIMSGNKDCTQALPEGVKHQCAKMMLFKGRGSQAVQRVSLAGNSNSSSSPVAEYLIGKFDCMAIPSRADFDSNFEEVKSVTPAPGSPAQASSASQPDFDVSSTGWFWMLHMSAPNIGESEEAEDFPAYSKPDAYGKLRLDQDEYLRDMKELWRTAIMSMGRLGVDDGVIFPFGMGAFLRNLGKVDDHYSKYDERMRGLRKGIAEMVMDGIESLYGEPVDVADPFATAPPPAEAAPKAAAKATAAPKAKAKAKAKAAPKAAAKAVQAKPARIHLCLSVANAQESIENHNVFIEAASQKAKTFPRLKDLLQIHRNIDVLQVAINLSGQSALKVAVLNGANRKLIGNHWFTDGASLAIDENLHRRSASMARVALLLNSGVAPRDRRDDELADIVRILHGQVVSLYDKDGKGAAPAANAKKEGGGGIFGCCAKRKKPPANGAASANQGAPKGSAAAPKAAAAGAKAKPGKAPAKGPDRV